MRNKMGILSNIVSGIGGAIGSVVDVICDWAREPLRTREHNRREQSAYNAHSYAMESNRTHHRHELELLEKKAEITEREQQLEIEKIQKIAEFNAQLEEWKKDKALERMQLTTEAIMRYQQQLTSLNVQAIQAIGLMQLDLKNKAQEMVYEKTLKYKKLQDDALEQCILEISKIEENFADNPRAQEILYRSADKKLQNVIDTASAFLAELNADITNLNLSITNLTEQGQRFIEGHLNNFYITQNLNIPEISDEMEYQPKSLINKK